MLSKALLATVLLSLFALSTSLSCLDRNGKDVAWFNVLKFPGNVTTDEPKYAYFDVNQKGGFQVIKGSYCDTQGQPLALTIAAINGLVGDEDLNLLVFNDENPNGKTTYSGAHAKGWIAYDNQTKSGVYVMHSFPKYPSVTDEGEIDPTTPENTKEYGQNAYCITLDEKSIDVIFNHLPVEKPNVYQATGFFKKMKKSSTQDYLIDQFTLVNGEVQYMITKNYKYKGLLYDDIIAPHFKVGIAVESWGRPYQKAVCTANQQSLNIDKIAFSTGDSWDHFADHAKWAVTLKGAKTPLACSCDMNRMSSQAKRGGSCLCSTNSIWHDALSALIVQEDQCNTGKFLAVDA